MARPIVTRRGLFLSTLAASAALAACAPPEPPPPPPPMLVVSSAAALGTVIQADPAGGGVTVRAQDGIFSMPTGATSRRGSRRSGGRVLVVFAESRPPRLAPAAQINDPTRNLVTIQAMNPGATELVVLGPQGGAQTVYVEDPAIAAFLTRVGRGSQASLTFRQVAAGSIY